MTLRAAAERGMRVRLLLDDNNTAGLDPLLSALDAHPNIEVRLFNPFTHRGLRLLGYLTDFAPAQPAHAQQVLHRRQPGDDHRRAQCPEPGTSFGQRAAVWLLSLLRIEWML